MQYRMVAGPKHGETVALMGHEMRVMWFGSNAGLMRPGTYVPVDAPEFNETIYRTKTLSIPMVTKGVKWFYVEMILVPTWCSDETAAAALKELGIPPK